MKLAGMFLALSTIANTSATDKRFFVETHGRLPPCIVEVEKQFDCHGREFLEVLKPDCFRVRWKKIYNSEFKRHAGPANICYCPTGVDCGTDHTRGVRHKY